MEKKKNADTEDYYSGHKRCTKQPDMPVQVLEEEQITSLLGNYYNYF